MRIYFEQRELFYIEAEGDNFEEALASAQEQANGDMFWEDASETGQMDTFWFDQETNEMLQD